MGLNFAEDLYSSMDYSSSHQSRYFILTIKQLFSKAHNLHSNLGMKVTSLIILTSSIIDKNLEINIFSKIDSKIELKISVLFNGRWSHYEVYSVTSFQMQKWPQTFFEVTYPFVKSISEVCIPPNIYLHSKPSDMHELIRNVKALLTPFPGQFVYATWCFCSAATAISQNHSQTSWNCLTANWTLVFWWIWS